jgi:hypothetical protein
MLKLIQSITGIYELTWSEILLGISLAVVFYFALVIAFAF